MEMPTAIVVRDDKFKVLPPSGFTFMMGAFSSLLFDINQKDRRCGSGFQAFPAAMVHIV